MHSDPLSPRALVAGLIITVVGGLIVSYLIQEGRFQPGAVTQQLNFQQKKNPSIHIGNTELELGAIRFFESGEGVTPQEERNYVDKFVDKSARYINWELNLAHRAQGTRLDFEIDAVFYNPDGSILTKSSIDTYLNPAWTSSYHYSGWGWNTPGNWKAGSYSVVFFIEGKKIHTQSFEVVEFNQLLNVKDIKFFESGSGFVTKKERNYLDKFSKKTTRYINWELSINHPKMGEKVPFTIEAITYKPDGGILAKNSLETYLSGDWTSSNHTHGWGWDNKGNWQPGYYKTVFKIDNTIVGEDVFNIR